MNLAIIREAEGKLKAAGISNALMESRWMLEHAGNLRNAESDLCKFDEMVKRRAERFPLAYLLGSQFFSGLNFKVNPSVLIPREETELLVHKSSERIAGLASPKVLEIGTGSGCISVCLALKNPSLRVLAVDLSEQALGIAAENAKSHAIESRIRFLRSDLYRNIPEGEKFDLIVSNPPYIRTEELRSLEPEIGYEPRMALDGGSDGLEIIRKIVLDAPQYLSSGGALALEIGYDQRESGTALMAAAGFQRIEAFKDFSGIDRVLMGRI